MRLSQEHFDSLATKLNALSAEEQMALRVAVALSADSDDVVGFANDTLHRTDNGFVYAKVEWVWKAPAGTETNLRAPGSCLLDYDWIA